MSNFMIEKELFDVICFVMGGSFLEMLVEIFVWFVCLICGMVEFVDVEMKCWGVYVFFVFCCIIFC